MANPRGQQRDKPYRDALRRAIARAEQDQSAHTLDRIADNHLKVAASGDIGALKELADRVDGKVPQAIAGVDENEQLTPLVPVINLTIGAKSNAAPEAGGSVSDEGH